MTRIIKHLVVMGDSLSDRGTMKHRKLLGFIPMDTLSGLKAKKTPDNRFTNGYNWADDLAARLAVRFELQELLVQEGMKVTEVISALEAGNSKVKDILTGSFFLGDDRHIRFQGKDLLRSYAEGGLTAHDYGNSLSLLGGVIGSPTTAAHDEGARLTVSTLAAKRKLLLQDDKREKISATHKAQTLVIEWSGANDLITVNEQPTAAEVNKAITARIKNVEALIKQGYRNFSLFNLPDLSLTPQYQAASKNKRDNAHAMSLLFNENLAKAIEKLKHKYPHSCQIELFDINQEFTKIYNDPEEYGFDNAKKHTPYVESAAFKSEGAKAPSNGHMFWDDKHPSAPLHAALANKAYQFINSKFTVASPHNLNAPYEVNQGLLDAFTMAYDTRFRTDKTTLFGFFKSSRLHIDKHASAQQNLENILEHALYDKGHRTLNILKELNWLNHKNQLNIAEDIPNALVEAYAAVTSQHQQERHCCC